MKQGRALLEMSVVGVLVEGQTQNDISNILLTCETKAWKNELQWKKTNFRASICILYVCAVLLSWWEAQKYTKK